MIADVQQQLLGTLAEIWSLSPDVRLGQLMAHLGFLGEVHAHHGLGEIENDELLAIMYRHRAELLARLPGVSQTILPLSGADASVSGNAMSAPTQS
jgi:hypothetical protein